jgi:vacuolar-type H+-ATPase subunit E/Vma4
MNTARPIISTPEAEAVSAASMHTASTAHANGSSRTGSERHQAHDSGAQEASTPAHLTRVVADQAQEQAVRLTREARRQAAVNLEQQTKRAARIVGALGTALHEAGKQLRAENEPLAANYYDMAGDRITHLASSIEQQDPEQLIGMVQRLARRQPIVFVGAAALVGVVGMRALKSSSTARDQARPSRALPSGAR